MVAPLTLPAPPRVTRTILIVLAGIWLAELALYVAQGFDAAWMNTWVFRPLSLRVDLLFDGWLWQPLTYALFHSLDGVGHIFFSLLTLYFFGTGLERETNGRTVLQVLALGVVAGAVAFVAVEVLAGLLVDGGGRSLLGISAGASALVGATCWLWRDRPLNLILFTLTGRHLLIGLVALDILRGLTGAGTSVGAQLGGIAAGVLWAISVQGGPGGWHPRRLWLRMRLWWSRRRLRALEGGRDRHDFRGPTRH